LPLITVRRHSTSKPKLSDRSILATNI